MRLRIMDVDASSLQLDDETPPAETAIADPL